MISDAEHFFMCLLANLPVFLWEVFMFISFLRLLTRFWNLFCFFVEYFIIKKMLSVIHDQRSPNQDSKMLVENGTYQKSGNSLCCWDRGVKGTLFVAGGGTFPVYGEFLVNLELNCYMIQQLHFWASIYPWYVKTLKRIYTYTIAAQSAVAKLRNQPRCPMIDEWVMKMYYCVWYIHTYIYIHAHNGVLASVGYHEIMQLLLRDWNW